MPFDPTSFANLFAYSSFANTYNLKFDGAGAWFADAHNCVTVSGGIEGSITCPGWDHVANPDPIDLLPVAALGADFVTARIVTSVSTFDVGSDGCNLLSEGGGCHYRDPLIALMNWLDQGGGVLSGVQDDGTSNGSGPYEVDGLALGGCLTGPDRLVNPAPPHYFGIDPTNSANEILWRPDSMTSLSWKWTDGIEANFAGAEHDLSVQIGFTLYHYIDAPTPDAGLICWL